MKKLLVYLLLLVLAVGAVWFARSRSWGVLLPAQELAQVAAVISMEKLEAQGVPVPRHAALETMLAWLLLPGVYVFSRFGIDPDTGWALVGAALVGWWVWGTVPRLVWHVVGRPLGLVNIGHFSQWLLLVPPWRALYRLWLRPQRWYRQFRYGVQATAAWTGLLEAMTLVFKPVDCVFLGRLWVYGLGAFQPIGIRGPRHVAVVAAPGAGKTRWLIASLGMLHKDGSAFVIDTDGQIVNALGAKLERDGHRIVVLDPFNLTNHPSGCWDAMGELDRAVKRHGRKALIRFAQTLAEALIQEDNKHQPVFANSARAFMLGLILYVWLFEPPERRNLVRVRELLTRGMPEQVIDAKQDPFEVLLSVMAQAVRYDDKCGGQITAVIARAASVMKGGRNREGGNPFRTTAMSQTNWLDLPEIAAISTRSDFAGEDLKTGNIVVFICVPVTDIQEKVAGWIRSNTMMSMYAFENMPGKLKIPSAFCIDEMPSLGYIRMLETGSAVFRRFGIRLIIITQDIERLRQTYPNSWGGFLGHAQCTLWMSNDHQETLDYQSKSLGSRTIKQKIDGGVLSDIPARLENRERPLMAPDQLREFLDPERGQIIVTRTGKRPLRITYEGCPEALAVWQYEADRNFREPLLRPLTRTALNWLRPRKPLAGPRSAPAAPRPRPEVPHDKDKAA